MTYWCSECKKPITLMDDNNVPLYRKAKLIASQWAVVKYFCSPNCSLDEYENNERDTITDNG